jgi:hypothetical protein
MRHSVVLTSFIVNRCFLEVTRERRLSMVCVNRPEAMSGRHGKHKLNFMLKCGQVFLTLVSDISQVGKLGRPAPAVLNTVSD